MHFIQIMDKHMETRTPRIKNGPTNFGGEHPSPKEAENMNTENGSNSKPRSIGHGTDIVEELVKFCSQDTQWNQAEPNHKGKLAQSMIANAQKSQFTGTSTISRVQVTYTKSLGEMQQHFAYLERAVQAASNTKTEIKMGQRL